jgi:uncharacterized protein YoxC
MNAGDIVGLVFAGGFVLLVLLLGFPLIKLGRLLERSSQTVETLNRELEPILSETRVTLTETNKQLAKVDRITSDIEQVTGNVNGMVAAFTNSAAGPLSKIVAASKFLSRLIDRRR